MRKITFAEKIVRTMNEGQLHMGIIQSFKHIFLYLVKSKYFGLEY